MTFFDVLQVVKSRKLMVCNWNKTQYELDRKKVQPTDSWADYEVDTGPTATNESKILSYIADISCFDEKCYVFVQFVSHPYPIHFLSSSRLCSMYQVFLFS